MPLQTSWLLYLQLDQMRLLFITQIVNRPRRPRAQDLCLFYSINLISSMLQTFSRFSYIQIQGANSSCLIGQRNTHDSSLPVRSAMCQALGQAEGVIPIPEEPTPASSPPLPCHMPLWDPCSVTSHSGIPALSHVTLESFWKASSCLFRPSDAN